MMKRRQVFKAAGAVGTAGLLGAIPQRARAVVNEAQVHSQPNEDAGTQEDAVEVTVVQNNAETNWVFPGKRPLSKQVFGSTSNPVRGTKLHKHKLAQLPNDPPGGITKERLVKFLTKGGLPPMAGTCPTGGKFKYNRTTYTIPNIREPFDPSDTTVKDRPINVDYQVPMMTPFGDRATSSEDNDAVSGQLDITYKNRQGRDTQNPAGPADTDDDVAVDCTFSDPAGNSYEIDIKKVVQPPMPFWESGGGVLTFSFHHGQTGTGPGIVPQVFTYGAMWAVADIYVDGTNETKEADAATSKTVKGRMCHIMTTEQTRDSKYRFVLDERLPLSKEEAYNGEKSVTHVMIPPVVVTPDGPLKLPMQAGYTLTKDDPVPGKMAGKTQPHIHFMFDEDTVREIKLIGSGYDGSYD